MSKLLPRAKVKLENAKNDYKKLGDDDAYIDDCCYNLQQSLELLLKYEVEMTGQTFVENHDVRAQLNKLANVGSQIPMQEEIRNMASVINCWEAESRYLDSFTATREDIDHVLKIVEELMKHADSLVEEINEREANKSLY